MERVISHDCNYLILRGKQYSAKKLFLHLQAMGKKLPRSQDIGRVGGPSKHYVISLEPFRIYRKIQLISRCIGKVACKSMVAK